MRFSVKGNVNLFIFTSCTVLLVSALFVAVVPAQSPPTWYNSSWAKARPIMVDNTLNPSALTGFQLKLTVDYDSDMKTDFSDLRFTEDDGVTLIPHCISTVTPSSSATVFVQVPAIPASDTTTIYMYYGNPDASDASDGDATFEFFDDFTGSTLDPAKWVADAVNDITHTVNDYFRFEDASKSGGTYWIYDGSDTGSQHQADWTPSSQFIIEFRTRMSDVASAEMGEGFVGLVATDNTVIGVAGYQDWMGGSVQSQRGVVTENEASSVGSGVAKRSDSAYVTYRTASAADATNWMIVNDGTNLEFYDDGGFFAEASISSTISKLALVAGAFGPYNYLDYVEVGNILVRQYASPEPISLIGSEEDYRMKGRIIWWNGSWLYRQPIAITENSGYSQLNYQVKLTVPHVTSKMNPDFSDLRFTGEDQTTQIPYWIESYTASVSADIWVRIPTLPASETTTIYMYYGNPSATSESNGTATFEFFDDFETAYPIAWTKMEPMLGPKADLSCAVYNGKLYAFGGYLTGSTWLNETYEYDPSTDTWTQKADMPTRRWGPIAVECGGKIYVFSGTANVAEVYDPATDSWASLGTPPSTLNQGLMGVKYGDKIHLFYHTVHYEYDPATDTYTSKTPMPTSRRWGTCAVVGDRIYVIGGYPTTNVNEVYDPATDTWATLTPMPVSKYGATREDPVIDGKIYITHGLNGGFHTDNYVYDPVADSWTQKSSAVHPRDGVGCGVIDDKLYVVGGRNVTGSPYGIDTHYMYDPASDTGMPLPWAFSNPDKVKRDTAANYEGSYGLLIYEDVVTTPQYAEHTHNYAQCAVDLYWDITDTFGTATVQPQGRIMLADSSNPSLGSLYYYNDGGTANFRWYTGSFTTLQSGSWNTWYPITIIWNGANSRVIISDTEHSITATAVNSDRIHFNTYEHTQMYIDLVRVRKYTAPSPTATAGTEETPANIESCGVSGSEKNSFNPNEAVYVKGSGFKPSTLYNIYVVDDVTTWSNGDPIPSPIPGTASTITSNEAGEIQPTIVWTTPLTPGTYDIILDAYENGEYDASIDALDDLDISTAGFFVIPEYIVGTILAVATCFAASGAFWKAKRKKRAVNTPI